MISFAVIDAERKRRNMTMTNLARELGVSRVTLTNWKQGGLENTTVRSIIKLADLFECSVDHLLGLEYGRINVYDLLKCWNGWSRQDKFIVYETAIKYAKPGRVMTGTELMTGSLAKRTVVHFGSYVKQDDGPRRHYVVIKPE